MSNNNKVEELKSQIDFRWLRLLIILPILIIIDNQFSSSNLTAYIYQHFHASNFVMFTAYLIIVFFTSMISLFILKFENKYIALSVCILFILSCIVESVYAPLNYKGFSFAEIAIALNAFHLIGDAVATYVTYKNYVTFLFFIIFWVVIFIVVRKERWFGRNINLRTGTCVIIMLLIIDTGVFTLLKSFHHYPSYIKTIHQITACFFLRKPIKERVDVEVHVKNEELLANHVVLIIDESIRGDKLSINGFMKKTTPFLDSFKDSIINLGIASSAGTISYISNTIIINGVQRERLPDIDFKTETHQSLMYFAKKAGYYTCYIDIQAVKLKDAFRFSDKQYMDETYFHNDSLYKEKSMVYGDFMAIPIIKNVISSQDKSFTLLLKRGSHFKFENRYPDSLKIFKPTQKKNEGFTSNVLAMRNSYYNALHWVVDVFWEELVQAIYDKDVVILYTSDHAQSLMEDPHYQRTHGGDKREQAIVPLWLSANGNIREKIYKRYGKEFVCENYNSLSHFNIFPTILEFFNIENNPYGGHSIFNTVKTERVYYKCGRGRLNDIEPIPFDGNKKN